MKSKSILLLGTSLFAVAASPVLAETTLEEIVVTAQKREESLQEVPIALQAFTGDQLQKMGVKRARDVVKLAPNLNISGQNPANQQINIRGVGTNSFFGSASGSVGIYMDEVTISSPYMTSLGLYDMERVEVLRGPQNSLFGRNTTGGAVNYISKMPEVGGEVEGYLDLGYGRFNEVEIEGAVSIPLGDTLAVRIAGKSYDRDGIWHDVFADDMFGEKDRKSLRGTLLWEPTDATRITANIHWAKEDSEFDGYRYVGTRATAANGAAVDGAFVGPAPLAGSQIDYENGMYDTVNAQGIDSSFPNWNDTARTGANYHKVDTTGAYLKIQHDFESMTLTSITAYDESTTKFTVDASGAGNTNGQANLIIDQDQDFEQFSQEIRLASPSDREFRWIVGMFYFNEDAVLSQNIRFGDATVLSLPFDAGDPDIAIGPPILAGGSFGLWALSQHLAFGIPEAGYANSLAFSIATIENEVWSPYLRTEYDFTDDLTLTVGVRYTSDKKKMPSYYVGILDTSGHALDTFWSNDYVRAEAAAQAPGDCTEDGRRCAEDTVGDDIDTEEWGGRIGLDYHVNEDVLVYGSYSRGFRSGSYDIEFLHGIHTGFIRQDLTTETLDAFEVGFKSDLMDNAMQFNMAAYYYIWKNQQTFYVDPATGPEFVNVPKSELYGLEAELKWVPADTWYVSAGAGFQQTKILEASPTPVDEQGHELPYAASTSFNMLLSKDFYIGDNILNIQGTWAYRSSPKATLNTADLIDELGAMSELGVRASYSFGDEQQYSITAYGENLTEDKYCTYKFDLGVINGTAYCVPNEGVAIYGVRGKVNF
ncbi:TonB-dependent receptor [Emcibacter nanhaiensis]|uniref:TonB-dependent receptor n=1 Tax=Emcibacter nanhaiensis TaxID=1505037 RepID=A0A501PPY8_9PROT|nr:TonB-dependent receptor [Emcibacter nanhaiensis]TPD61856.1 TonB-dependent receptor [Emcibacter nanhaiensis]